MASVSARPRAVISALQGKRTRRSMRSKAEEATGIDMRGDAVKTKLAMRGVVRPDGRRDQWCQARARKVAGSKRRLRSSPTR